MSSKSPKSPKVVPIEEWLESFRQATTELASGTLRFDTSSASPSSKKSAEPRPGAYIALLGKTDSMHLGISATTEGCRAIARGLMSMRTESQLSDQDVMDGVSEVINILAGKVKSKMINRDASLRLGLPMFIVGEIRATEQMEQASANVRMGPVDCKLTVYRNKRAA